MFNTCELADLPDEIIELIWARVPLASRACFGAANARIHAIGARLVKTVVVDHMMAPSLSSSSSKAPRGARPVTLVLRLSSDSIRAALRALQDDGGMGLARLNCVEICVIGGTPSTPPTVQVTSADMAELCACAPRLSSLKLSGVSVADRRAFEPLQALRLPLSRLCLSDVHPDSDLSSVGGLSGLTSLRLEDAPVVPLLREGGVGVIMALESLAIIRPLDGVSDSYSDGVSDGFCDCVASFVAGATPALQSLELAFVGSPVAPALRPMLRPMLRALLAAGETKRGLSLRRLCVQPSALVSSDEVAMLAQLPNLEAVDVDYLDFRCYSSPFFFSSFSAAACAKRELMLRLSPEAYVLEAELEALQQCALRHGVCVCPLTLLGVGWGGAAGMQ